MNNADQRMFQLQLPLFTNSRLRGKQTNGGGSAWSIEGRTNTTNCLWRLKRTGRKTPSNFIESFCLFIKLGAATNWKLNTTQRTIHVQRRKRRIIVEMNLKKALTRRKLTKRMMSNSIMSMTVTVTTTMWMVVNGQVVYHKCNNEHMTSEIVHYHSKICMQSHQNII